MSKITVTKTYIEDYNKCKWLVDGKCVNMQQRIPYNHCLYPEILGKECIEGNYKCFEKEDGEIVP